MGVIAHNEEDVKLLARLMRAEAEGRATRNVNGWKCWSKSCPRELFRL